FQLVFYSHYFFSLFFNAPATSDIYTLSLHDALPICFEYYHDELTDVPKLSVDGTVANAVHFSHWQGNQTPASVKADTSTEIALKDRKSTRLNSSHVEISYAVFCLKKKKKICK